MKIVSFKICPFVQRVTALLEAKKLPYEIEYISLSNKPEWFLDASPNGQVPLLITKNGTSLFESDAIIEYIEEITTPLESNISAEQRALNRAWSYMATKHYLTQCSTMRSNDLTSYEQRNKKLNAIYQKANTMLKAPYFYGDTLSSVDIAWLPLLHRAEIVARHSQVDPLASFPKVKLWQQALLATELFEQSVSSDFEERFTDFYINENNYLGQKNELSASCNEKCSANNTSSKKTEACC